MAKKKESEYTQEMMIGEIQVNQQQQEEIFLIVKNNGKYLIALTNKIVSKKVFDTVEEARTYIQSKPWELILNSCAVMMATLENINNANN